MAGGNAPPTSVPPAPATGRSTDAASSPGTPPPAGRPAPSPISKSRVESLSDLIFGLALSIGAVILIGTTPQTPNDVLFALLEFAISFAVLISTWFRYTRIMRDLPLETSRSLTLNTVLLFLVVIEPYLFNTLWHPVGGAGGMVADTSSSLFALDIGGMQLILSAFSLVVYRTPNSTRPPEEQIELAVGGVVSFGAGLLWMISAFHTFWVHAFEGYPLRYYVWGAALLLSWYYRGSLRKKARAFEPIVPDHLAQFATARVGVPPPPGPGRP